MNWKTILIVIITGLLTFWLGWFLNDMKQFADGENADTKRIDSLRKANPNFGTITQQELDSIMGSSATPDFQTKVDSFLKKYLADFSISKDNLNGSGQGYDFEDKTKPIWVKRITLKCKTSFVNNYPQTVYQRLYLSFFQYKSDKQCTAALDSLLNCFGGMCTKLQWDVKGQSAKTIPCIYLFNEKEIVACYINCEHQNDFWIKFKHDIEMTFSNGASRVMETGCGGPINFKKL